MEHFANAKEDMVTQAIDGTIAAAGGKLTRLDGYPHIRVVVRSDWDKSKVALVSGGGSGHEPAHAGFVGEGMLTAAVCGDVFASPSVDAVLAGILAVTGPAGCLLIVKNYTGDRLNFGLAAERARAFGHKVAMVIVDDDVALPDLPQARGVAGMPQTPHVALVNNLGRASFLEMSILTDTLLRSDLGGHIRHVIGPDAMMTALDMHGFSISLMELSNGDEDLLAQPVGAPAWPGCNKVQVPDVLPLPDGLSPIRAPASQHEPTKAFLTDCCNVLIASETDLNLLDVKSGDGDTGSTLATAARAPIEAMDTLPLADHTQLYRAIGLELSQTMGGSSGVLLAIFFAAAGDASSSGMPMKDALKMGLDRMQEIGGANPGDGTNLPSERHLICTGYAIYGPSSMLVLTVNGTVNGFSLDPETDTFFLTHPAMTVPPETVEFAINVSRQRHWDRPLQNYIADCIDGPNGPHGKSFNMRWTASMVAEVHRILIRGGICLYPVDAENRPLGGKLRLLYEAYPMALIIEAADAVNSPVIMQASRGARAFANDIVLSHLIKAAIGLYPHIPVCMHQDHGNSPATCLSAIINGFSSVMMDGSLTEDGSRPTTFAENVAVTRVVVEMAHMVGVSGEGEIGHLGSLESGRGEAEDGHGYDGVLSRDMLLTDPQEASDFVEQTGVDALAVAIGTSHGAYEFTRKPDGEILAIDRLKEIQRGIQYSVRKVNVDTDLRWR